MAQATRNSMLTSLLRVHLRLPAAEQHLMAMAKPFRPKSYGTRSQRTKAQPAAASAPSLRCPAISNQRMFPNNPRRISSGAEYPDVAGDADPSTGYQVRVNGQNQVIGGTSAVAPLWAGLVALMNQQLGKPVGIPQSEALHARFRQFSATSPAEIMMTRISATTRPKPGGIHAPVGQPERRSPP